MNGAAYVLVVLGILLAKGLGFLRDIVFASVFGATSHTDIYFQVFGLVNLIFTGIGVALSTLVIKNLNKAENDTEEKKRAYVSGFIVKTSLIILGVTALMYISAKPIAMFLLPGLEEEFIPLAVKLMYIMLPSFLFVVIAYIISGVLQNNRVFFISSVMSLPFNVVIIASLFVKNVDVVTVGIVTTIGWFLHIAVQLPSFYKKGYSLVRHYSKNQSFKGNNTEILYIFISNMMFQICFMIDKAFVSSESGAATTINYASNLFVTISSVFVVAMSNVVFPSISKNYEEGKLDYVRDLIKYIITVMAAIFVPFIMTVCCFGKNIISLLYERGEFTSELTVSTAILFAVYTLGALGYICQELLNKVLYLDSKYNYTVIGTILVVALKLIINFFLADYGAVFVSLSTTVLFILYGLAILYGLSRVVGKYFKGELFANLFKIFVSALAAIAVYFICRLLIGNMVADKIMFIIPLGLCGIVYVGMLFVSGILKKLIKR